MIGTALGGDRRAAGGARERSTQRAVDEARRRRRRSVPMTSPPSGLRERRDGPTAAAGTGRRPSSSPSAATIDGWAGQDERLEVRCAPTEHSQTTMPGDEDDDGRQVASAGSGRRARAAPARAARRRARRRRRRDARAPDRAHPTAPSGDRPLCRCGPADAHRSTPDVAAAGAERLADRGDRARSSGASRACPRRAGRGRSMSMIVRDPARPGAHDDDPRREEHAPRGSSGSRTRSSSRSAPRSGGPRRSSARGSSRRAPRTARP